MPFYAYDAATHLIGRARYLLEASRSRVGIKLATVRTDMRRLSTIMAVAALDTYMHRLIVERAFKHGDELPPPLAKLDLPFQHVLGWADESKEAARAEPHNSRPRVAVKKQLRERLLRDTFQSFDDVGRAMKMAGRARNWAAIGQELEPSMRPEEIRERLNEIVVRRNQIVHEGDYERKERPQRPIRNAMTYSQARADIDFIADLIDAIHEAD